ncbi:DNA-binding transcriptional LysR family regulator [Humitalea rosea]|uniref:DNA-binding transcriptional LysR family regulator n=1 Tax=Humitalea rosea TaxID=990373 RepID=A0A2W7JTY8_9PROT|nr:LysR substrate-binding domain-containing protein [Humitalea rosea]PZW38920.1 DNA-binding transcriptional LysR family regulator [Humitalea rosea]
MMSLPPGLDPDLLRAFVLIAEGGSVTRAAERVGRTQSAVSMQIRRLEEAVGQTLLIRTPGGMVPTPRGLWLLERARAVLALNDEILATLRAPPMTGTVRLGTPDDYALNWLPGILARFAEAHPSVELDVTCLNSGGLAERMRAGQLDLSLLTEGHQPHGMMGKQIWRGPLRWVGSPSHALHRRDPLPLALALDESGCPWRRAALSALHDAGHRARVTYNSATQTGCFTVALAGLALTVSTPTALPEGLTWMGEAEGLPPLPLMGIVLLRSPAMAGDRAAETLAMYIEEGFRQAESGRLGLSPVLVGA